MLVTVTTGTTLAVGSTVWYPGGVRLLSSHTVYVQLPKRCTLFAHRVEKKWILRVALNLPSVVYIVLDYTVTGADPWTRGRHLCEH